MVFLREYLLAGHPVQYTNVAVFSYTLGDACNEPMSSNPFSALEPRSVHALTQAQVCLGFCCLLCGAKDQTQHLMSAVKPSTTEAPPSP